MIKVGKEYYDKAVVVGKDIIRGGNLDGKYTIYRMFALYRGDTVVGYTEREVEFTTPSSTPYPPPIGS